MLNPSLFNFVPAPLRQPSNVAILVSVGVHGALAVGWPLLPASSSKPVQRWQTVDLVQLSPAEQKRLPNLSKPQLALGTAPAKPASIPAMPSIPSLTPADMQAQLQAAQNNLPVSEYPPVPPPPPMSAMPALPAPSLSYPTYIPPSPLSSYPTYIPPAPSLYSNVPLPPVQSAYSNLSVLPPSPRLTPNWSEVPAPSPSSNLSALPPAVNSFIAQPQIPSLAAAQPGLSIADPALPADQPDSWGPAPPALAAPQIAARTEMPAAQAPPPAASQDSNLPTLQQFRQQQPQGAAGLQASPGQSGRASALLPAQEAQVAQKLEQWQQADLNRAAAAAQPQPAAPPAAAPPNVHPQLWAYYQQLQRQKQAERQQAAARAAESQPAPPAPVAGPQQVMAAAQASLEEKERQIQQQAAATPADGTAARREAMLAGGGAYASWVGSLKQAHSDVQMASPIPMRAPYPPEASSKQLEGRAVVGVLVGAGGEILDGPTLLVPTESPALNEAALNAVKGVPLKATGKTVAYQFSFEFKPDSQTPPAPAQPAPAPAQPAPAPAQPAPAQPAPAQPAQPAPAPAQPAQPAPAPAPAPPEQPAPAPPEQQAPAPAPAPPEPAPAPPAEPAPQPAPPAPEGQPSPP